MVTDSTSQYVHWMNEYSSTKGSRSVRARGGASIKASQVKQIVPLLPWARGDGMWHVWLEAAALCSALLHRLGSLTFFSLDLYRTNCVSRRLADETWACPALTWMPTPGPGGLTHHIPDIGLLAHFDLTVCRLLAFNLHTDMLASSSSLALDCGSR